jgi:hypothetical protein
VAGGTGAVVTVLLLPFFFDEFALAAPFAFLAAAEFAEAF